MKIRQPEVAVYSYSIFLPFKYVCSSLENFAIIKKKVFLNFSLIHIN